MKAKKLVCFVLSVLGVLSLAGGVMAADLSVGGYLAGIYYSPGNIIVQSGSTVQAGSGVSLIAVGKVFISSGFRVQSGSTFFIVHADNTDSDADGIPDRGTHREA